MSVTEQLAEFAVSMRLDDVPPEVVERARMRILDTLGVTLAGAHDDCAKIAVSVAADDSRTASTLIGHTRRASPISAALVNGISAHALEYDDMTSSVMTHSSASVVPASLAVAEVKAATGAKFLEAYIVGFEISTRIGLGLCDQLLPRGWHPNGVLAVIGSAAAAARLLGANLKEVRTAMGIAASCSSGIRKNVGYMTKAFHMGHAASDGVMAALLAEQGFTADVDILDQGSTDDSFATSAHPAHNRFSFPEVFAGPGNYDLEKMIEGLGTTYELASSSTITRFHPGATFPQAAIDETIQLVNAHAIAADEITGVRVEVTPLCFALAPYVAPLSGLFARFSIPYSIAVAAIDHEVSHRQYADDRVCKDDVQNLLRRVTVEVPNEWEGVTHDWRDEAPTPLSCRIAITIRSGQVYRGERHTTRGFPGTDVTWADVLEKYRTCAEGVLPQELAELSASLVAGLVDLPNVRQLTALLAGQTLV